MENTIVMGADYYQHQQPLGTSPSIGIGDGTEVCNAIIDKNACIGKNCVIKPDNKPSHHDHPLFNIRDGIIVIPKNTIIPDNTIL